MHLDDWMKYPAVIQDNTKNLSFLRISKILKMLGIKNNHFMLALHDRSLLHVDPHDLNNITPDLATRIFLECRRNIWYYLREIVRVPTQGGMPVPFEAHRGNIALAWAYYSDLDVGLTQPRQTGKTIGTQSIMSHQLYFQGYSFDIGMYTKDHSLLLDNVLRLKNIKDGIPTYLIEKDGRGRDKDAKEGLSYTALKNQYLTYVNANGELDAEKLGRGATAPTVHIDEIAYFNYIWITFSSIIATTATAVENAAKLGKRCSNIYTTTAGRTDTDAGKFALRLLDSGMVFTEKLYDCKDKEQLHEIVGKHSRGGRLVYATFSHRQLGKTDEWLRATILRTQAITPEDIEREYLNRWTAGQENSAIDPKLLAKIQASVIEPKHTTINDDGFSINWYIHEDQIPLYKNKPIIIGMDSSEQVGMDDTTLVFLDPTNMAILATLRCNDQSITWLAKFLSELLVKEFPKAVFIPECKSTGRAILDHILDEFEIQGINPWLRIYNRAVQDKQEPQYSDFNIYTELATGLNRKLFGFVTSGGTGIHSRNMLYKTTMAKTLHLNHSRIYDTTLSRQLSMLVVKNGRVNHTGDGHDDMVIAYLLASWLLFFGKNLKIYGLNSDIILSDIDSEGSAIQDKSKMHKYVELKNQIKQLNQLLLECPPSGIIKHKYTRQLKELTQLVDAMDVQTTPITREQSTTATRDALTGGQVGMTVAKAYQLDRYII